MTDLATFLRAWMGGGEADGVRILAEASVEEALADQLDERWEQGLIWYADDRTPGHAWGHSGSDSGVSAQLSFREEDATGVILLADVLAP